MMPEAASGRADVLTCESVWKVFGPRAAQHLADAGGVLPPTVAARHHLVPAVRDVSLSIRPGEIFVIMGLSGSGKSTLLRCMSRLVEPTAGRVLFHGRDLLTLPEREMTAIRRHRMGMVFQNFALLPHMTVRQNVAFPLEVQGMRRTEREARVAGMIALVGLSGREGAYPRELSGGQQQRVGIARSLAAEPELWFLDEPFSALDPLIRREMQDELLRLQSGLRKSIVFVTHDFDEALRLADRMAIMKDGAVVQIGTPEELVLSPADDYVREFTRGVPRAKVAKVTAIMSAAAAGHLPPQSISARSSVADAAPLFLGGEVVLRVTDDDGDTIGLLHKTAVVDMMLGGQG